MSKHISVEKWWKSVASSTENERNVSHFLGVTDRNLTVMWDGSWTTKKRRQKCYSRYCETNICCAADQNTITLLDWWLGRFLSKVIKIVICLSPLTTIQHFSTFIYLFFHNEAPWWSPGRRGTSPPCSYECWMLQRRHPTLCQTLEARDTLSPNEITPSDRWQVPLSLRCII